MWSIKTIVCIVSLLPFTATAQEVLTLDEILARVSNNNLALQPYADRAESYKYKAEAATAWMAPMVGLGTWQTPYPGQMLMEPGDRGMLMFRAEQAIPNKTKQQATKNYLLSLGDVEKAGRAVTLNTLKAEAQRQYYAWAVALKKLAVLRKNDQVLTTMKKIEEVRYPYNQSQLSTVYRTEAALEENRAMMFMQEAEIARAKGYLNALMNRKGDEEFIIDTNKVIRFVPAGITDTASLAMQRGDILRMNESIRAMKLNIEAMKAESKPEFRVQFDHMYPLSAMMPNAFSIMGMVTIPIAPWSSKMYKNEVKAMEYDIRAMETERSSMLQETQGMLYGMQGEILAMQNRLNAVERKVIPALQKTFDANFLLYQENRLSITALLDSWEALNMTQMNLWEERGKLYQMIADYEKELYR